MADDYSMSDFVTPGQVKAQREMAAALLQQSLNPPVGRVGEAISPFAIGAQMSEALAGKYLQNKAGQQERGSEIGGQQAMPVTPGGTGVPSRRADDITDPEGKALSMMESGGDYNALGPIIKKGSMTGDRAYGKYQVMGSNIPRWTQEFLGHQMTPGEFLRNPEAQEAVRKGKFAQYEQKYGPEGAARAWLGGPGGVNHPERADQLGTTVGQYGQNFMKNLAGAVPSPTGGQALAFSGEPAEAAAAPPGSPAPMSSALAGETKVAAGRPAPGAAAGPVPGGGLAPGVLPSRVTMTKEQFDRAMLSAPDKETRALLEAQYYSQNQPQVVKDSLGRDVVVGRDGSQMLINPPIGIKQKIGDIEDEPRFTQEIGPDGRPYLKQERTEGPGRATAPVAAPKVPEEPVPSLKFAPEGEGAAGEALPAEITKGPEAAAAERKGMLGTPPPPASTPLPFAETHLPNAPTGTESGVETPDLANMSMAEKAEWKRQFDLNKEAAKTFSTADVQKVSKTNEQFQNNARDTIQLENYINLGKKMLSDPRLQAMLGPGANLKMDWKSFLTFLGNKDAEASVGLRQAFDKITSSGIIGTLKADYGGLGQIRNKEIELSEKATSSPRNTVEANQAVLDIASRVVKQKQMLGKLANLYIQGQRWDKDGTPIPGKTVERPTFDGLTEVTNEYLKNHPLFDDKVKNADGKTELDRYLNIFKDSEKTESKKRKEGALPPGGKMGGGTVTPAAAAPASPKGLATHELPPGGSFSLMEDMTQPDTSKFNNYTAPDGSRYKRDGESWVLQDPGVAEDTLRSGAAGLGTGVHKVLTTPGTLGEMGLAGAQYLAGENSPLSGDLQHLRDEYTYPSSYEGSKHLVDKAFPFTTYEPQHTLGNVAKTGGDILPSAVLGGAGELALGAKLAPIAVRAGLSTAGGALGGGLTHDNMPLLEGPAEAAGMVAGMGGPWAARSLLKPAKGGVVEAAKNFGSTVGLPALGSAAGAYAASRFGQNPFHGATEGLIAGLIGASPVMKSTRELAGAAGRAVLPKAIPQTASAMVKALSKKTPYNTKGLDTATAAALLAGQGAPAGQSAVGPP